MDKQIRPRIAHSVKWIVIFSLSAVSWAMLALGQQALADSAKNPPPPGVVRIGFATIGVGGRQYAAISPVAVAQVQGLVEEKLKPLGIEVKWLFFKGAGPAINEAIAGHQLDFAIQGDLPSIIGHAAGLHTRLLLTGGTGLNAYVAVPAVSSAKSLEDLKNHTVADFKGTAGELSANRILADAAMSPRDFKLVNLDSGASLSALATGQVDAAFTGFYGFGLRDRGLVRIIYSTKNKSPFLLSTNALLVTDEFAQNYPDVELLVVRACVEAAHWASEESNRGALYEIWAKSGYPVSTFKDEFDGTDLKLRNSPLFDPFMIARYEKAAADSARFGLIRTSIDIDSWIDPRPLEQALAAEHLQNYWPRFSSEGKILPPS